MPSLGEISVNARLWWVVANSFRGYNFWIFGVTGTPLADADGEGLLDGLEKLLGTSPENPDIDGDGLSDGRGAEVGTDQ